MKTILFFTFLMALVKSGLYISIGILVMNHIETLLSLITRKPVPDNLIEKNNLTTFYIVTRWIGIFIIAIGVGIGITALVTLIMGFRMQTHTFNFNF
jgi:hypothetical protein